MANFFAVITVIFSSAFFSPAHADVDTLGDLIPDSPESEFLPAAPGEPSVDFCSQWNPEFAYRGYRCCSNQISRSFASTSRRDRRSRGNNSCAPNRIKWSFCDEMTSAQKNYIEDVKSGRIPDVLARIDLAKGSKGNQAFCGASNGFLAYGRPLLPTDDNRLEFRNLARCANFGTDPMVGMMEWVGREIKREYSEPDFSKIRLVIGDLSAPKGGCVAGRRGRRAHKSHTGGQDIDIAYFNARSGYSPEERFTRTFYVASNWWFFKKLFKNPYACVKVVFLDRSHISILEKYAKDKGDPEWDKLKKFIRHVRGHRDHFHVRIGEGPGVPGCQSDPTLEEDEDISDFGALPTLEIEKETDKDSDSEQDHSEEGTPPLNAADASVNSAALVVTPLAASLDALPHKHEPAITAQYEQKRRRRVSRRPARHRSRKSSR